MKQKFTQSTATKLSQKTLIWVWRSVLFSAMLGTIGYQQLEDYRNSQTVKTFIFTAQEDNFFENPANWYPSYPGTTIDNDQKMVIQDLAYVTGYDLQINGTLEIGLGATLFSAEGNLILGSQASLENHGELMMNGLQNEGTVANNMGAKIHVQHFHSNVDGEVENMKSASIIVVDSLTNQGSFRNYSYCSAQSFINTAHFEEIHGSELKVGGKPFKIAMRNP